MLRFLVVLVVIIPSYLGAQSPNPDSFFSSWASNPKVGNSLKIWSIPEKRSLFYQTDENKIALTGGFLGSKEAMVEKLSEISNHFNVFQRIFTIEIGPESINELLSWDEVVFLDAATRFNSPRPLDDKALTKSNVQAAQSLNFSGIKGDNVVIGIVDVGFQTTHPTFFNEDGTVYRVKRFWQQKYKNQMGPAPYGYGILKNSEKEILEAIDTDGSHGTHVAGIAGGSGFKSPDFKYAGVAPESELVFVGIKYQNDTIGGSALGDYLVANNAIIDGFDYVFRYADSLNKPAVCNLSWGMHTGPHDGTSLFDIALEDIINTPNPNSQKATGRALVGANGNSAQHEMHIKLELNGDSAATLAMDRSRNNFKTENVYCDFWSELNSNLQFQIVLIDSQDNVLIETPYWDFSKDTLISGKLVNNMDTFEVLLSGTRAYPYNGKSNFLMMLEANSNKRFIKINFRGKGEVHGWNSGRTYEWTAGTFRNYIRKYKPSHWVNGDAVSTLIENGGTSKAILSVGSYNNRVNWLNFEGKFQSDSAIDEGQISGFSSWGPALDGRLNPDVAAPGQFIANAYHKDAVPGWLSPYIVHKDQWNNDDVYWVLLSGTSMASPHAAGIVALMLQASEGQLSASDMYEIIRSTSQKDAYTGNQDNFQYGTGKIDAYKAIIASVNAMRNDKIEVKRPILIVQENRLCLVGMEASNSEIYFQIFDASGREVFSKKTRNKYISTDTISTGVYFVRFGLSGNSYSQTVFLDNNR